MNKNNIGLQFNFINLSTSLPFDEALKNRFYEVFDFETIKSFKRESYLNSLNIFFVDKLNKGIEEEIEPLGFYTKYSIICRNEAIYICPEDIYSYLLNCVNDFPNNTISTEKFQELYQSILLKIIIHEIAHAFMSEIEPEFEKMLKKDWRLVCDNSMHAPISSSINNNDLLLIKKSYYQNKTIEESLANAFVLLHKWNKDEAEIIKIFIKNQPPCYREACFWFDDKRLIEIMQEWRNFKFVATFFKTNIVQSQFDAISKLADVIHQYWNHGSKTCSAKSSLIYKDQFKCY